MKGRHNQNATENGAAPAKKGGGGPVSHRGSMARPRTHTVLHCRTPRCRDRSVLGVMSGHWKVVRELGDSDRAGEGEHVLQCKSRECGARWIVVQLGENAA